jgi:transcriptional regulator with XRE-family HTH domain
VLCRGDIAKAAETFCCHRNTIYKLWKRWNDTVSGEDISKALASRISTHSGRKPAYNVEEIKEAVREIPYYKRSTMRDLAGALNVSHSTLQRLTRDGAFKKHNTYLKPLLKPQHYLKRLEYALSKVHPITMKYDAMDNVVVIDEKIFYNDKDKRSFYLVDGEEVPQRACENKRYIGSSMFLVAVARPR